MKRSFGYACERGRFGPAICGTSGKPSVVLALGRPKVAFGLRLKLFGISEKSSRAGRRHARPKEYRVKQANLPLS